MNFADLKWTEELGRGWPQRIRAQHSLSLFTLNLLADKRGPGQNFVGEINFYRSYSKAISFEVSAPTAKEWKQSAYEKLALIASQLSAFAPPLPTILNTHLPPKPTTLPTKETVPLPLD